jgi:hypothetical protein
METDQSFNAAIPATTLAAPASRRIQALREIRTD